METKKIFLPESELPRQWYNIAADMPTPMEPPLHPGTGQPVGPDDLAPIFPRKGRNKGRTLCLKYSHMV